LPDVRIDEGAGMLTPPKFVPTRAQRKEIERENRRWPEQLQSIPKDEWPADPFEVAPRFAMHRSRRFLVQCFRDNGFVRLTVNRTDWDERAKAFRDGISWDDLQRLKAEAGYADAWAVEIYPPELEIVNVAPMRHLWLLPEAPAFCWLRGREARAA
jgi:hypothetical protein